MLQKPQDQTQQHLTALTLQFANKILAAASKPFPHNGLNLLPRAQQIDAAAQWAPSKSMEVAKRRNGIARHGSAGFGAVQRRESPSGDGTPNPRPSMFSEKLKRQIKQLNNGHANQDVGRDLQPAA